MRYTRPEINRTELRLVADAIRDMYQQVRPEDMDRWTAQRTLDWVVDGLCGRFEMANERFNRPRFLTAAGVPFDPETWDIDRTPRPVDVEGGDEARLRDALTRLSAERAAQPPKRGGKPKPGVVSPAMAYALAGAAADPQGRIPDGTGPTVVGALYDEGLAERKTAERPRRITQAGYRWVRDNPRWVETARRGEHDLIAAALAAAADDGQLP